MVFDAALFFPSAASQRHATVRSTPPSFFNRVRWSERIAPPPSSRARGSKRMGIAYEQRVADVLGAIYGTAFRRSPVISYLNRGCENLAIPDGVLRLNGFVYIIEVKLTHTEAVWPQLMDRYLPLVTVLEPRSRIRTVEVCRSYDPGVLLPGPHTLIDSLHRQEAVGLEVLQWKI